MGSFKQDAKKLRPKYNSFELHDIPSDIQVKIWIILLEALIILQGGRLLLNPQLATLTCDRPRPNLGMCQLVISGLLGAKTTPFPLEQLEGADTQRRRRSDQIVLHLSDQNLYFPVDRGFSFTEGKASQINVFLQDPTAQSLEVQQDNRWIYPFGGILTGFGSSLLALSLFNLHKHLTHRSEL